MKAVWRIKRRLLRSLEILGIVRALRWFLYAADANKEYARLWKGYLGERGWTLSASQNHQTGYTTPLDRHKNPIPWYTYALIDVLEKRIKPEWSVFEYGAGYSTIYYANKGLNVHAVDHDQKWVDALQKKIGHKAHVECQTNMEKYLGAIHQTKKQFHIVAVDGNFRVFTLIEAIKGLRKDGVIVLDDTHFLIYASAKQILHEQGFKSINFQDLRPISYRVTSTSVFYRPNNCLNL